MFMNIENDVSIKELYFWNNLNEDSFLNPGAADAIRNKKKVANCDRAWSPVYRNRRSPPGPVKAQRTYFKLQPVPPICICRTDEVEVKPADNRALLTDGKCKTKIQGKFTNEEPSSSVNITLTSFKDRQPTERTLLRRPTVRKAESLELEDELFEAFVNITQLRVLKFKKFSETYKFYQTHYPILLEKLVVEEQSSGTMPRRHTIAHDSPTSFMFKRKLELNYRLTEMESLLDKLEETTEPGDVKFKTVLRNPVFDPTSWPWAKEDKARMMRRYTMEALYKEIK